MKPAEKDMSESISITFPDGQSREYESGVTGFAVAESISKSLAKQSVAMRVNGDLWDLSRELTSDCEVSIVKRDDDDALDIIRHDCAHVLAEAAQNLFPGTQVTIGPVIENGFFYDFARDEPFSTEDLAAIEKEMAKIVDRNEPFVREVWDREEAIKHYEKIGETYKAEIIRDLPEDEVVTMYRQGEWIDLCRGPHLPSTKFVGKAFKLTKVAGAYWRGDSNNAMLTRIYGTAWRDQKELDAHLKQIEEAEKRDHRKIGKEMGLFHLQEEAQGSIFWHPKGFTIYHALENYVRRRVHGAGYVEVKTPQLMNQKFWVNSGHWGKYRENMFVTPDVVPNTEEDGPIFKEEPKDFMALKPMNCPAHVQIFKQGIKSYKDLPIRMTEFGCCHRNEAHGALHGIMRVRQFTQDDAHIFCREDQVIDEAKAFVKLYFDVYKDFGFEKIMVKLATRPELRYGDDALWDRAEGYLVDALEDLGIEYEIEEGDGAFYGPKYDFYFRDAIGRLWTCGTLQVDYVLPERLDASYVGQDGNRHRPVMLHRAICGSLERFIGILIENTAGRLPLWLAPVQCVVATITSEADSYAQDVYEKMRAQGLRVERDLRNEKISYKIREHSHAKVPVLFVIGAREAEEGTVAIRRLGEKDQPVEDHEAAIKSLAQSCKPPY